MLREITGKSILPIIAIMDVILPNTNSKQRTCVNILLNLNWQKPSPLEVQTFDLGDFGST